MKTLIRIAKKSAKNIQKKLLENGKPFCSVLGSEISVTKLFLNHILYHKNRNQKDLIQRLLIAAKQWIYFRKTRRKKITYRIGAEFGVDIFSVIVTKTAKETLLLSCFLENKYTKKRLV